jgi:hypothetical protein
MATLTFDDLTLEQVAFEVRYSDAFLIWDRSGAKSLVLASPGRLHGMLKSAAAAGNHNPWGLLESTK